jgi:Fe-S cluster biogenesis protein NfuA
MQIQDVTTTPNPNAVLIRVGFNLTSGFEILSSLTDPEHPVIASLMLRPSITDVMVQGAEITVRFDPDLATDGRDELRWVGSKLRNLPDNAAQDYVPQRIETSDDPTTLLIREVLAAEILPYLSSHGGSVQVLGVEDGAVLIRYMGACGGCPSSMGGTLSAIENVIQSEVDPNLTIRLV